MERGKSSSAVDTIQAQDNVSLMAGMYSFVLDMIGKAAARKAKGEGLEVDNREQCVQFIEQCFETVREQNWLDGSVLRAVTLVRNHQHTAQVDLSLGATAVGAAATLAGKAAKKWGGKASNNLTNVRPRRVSAGQERTSAVCTPSAVLETERTVRAPRDAAVTVQLRQRENCVEKSGEGDSVQVTAEEIFKEGRGLCWNGEKDNDHIYCTMKHAYPVPLDFSWYVCCVQLFSTMKLPDSK